MLVCNIKTIITTNNNAVFRINGADNIRITGFTFNGNNQGSGIYLYSDHHNFRIDSNKFTRFAGRTIEFEGYVDGVIDHNYFFENGHTEITYYHRVSEGDAAWNRLIVLGGTDGVLFVEDNNFTYINN